MKESHPEFSDHGENDWMPDQDMPSPAWHIAELERRDRDFRAGLEVPIEREVVKQAFLRLGEDKDDSSLRVILSAAKNPAGRATAEPGTDIPLDSSLRSE